LRQLRAGRLPGNAAPLPGYRSSSASRRTRNVGKTSETGHRAHTVARRPCASHLLPGFGSLAAQLMPPIAGRLIRFVDDALYRHGPSERRTAPELDNGHSFEHSARRSGCGDMVQRRGTTGRSPVLRFHSSPACCASGALSSPMASSDLCLEAKDPHTTDVLKACRRVDALGWPALAGLLPMRCDPGRRCSHCAAEERT